MHGWRVGALAPAPWPPPTAAKPCAFEGFGSAHLVALERTEHLPLPEQGRDATRVARNRGVKVLHGGGARRKVGTPLAHAIERSICGTICTLSALR
jgi:hypothetical protein